MSEPDYEAIGRNVSRSAIDYLLGNAIEDVRNAERTIEEQKKNVDRAWERVNTLLDDNRKLDQKIRCVEEDLKKARNEAKLRDTQNLMFRARAEAAEARVRQLGVPLCIGQEILGHLRDKGAWLAQDGRGVIAADDLFEGGGQSVYDALLAHTNSVRAQCTLPSAVFTTYITREAYEELRETLELRPHLSLVSIHVDRETRFAGAALRIIEGGGIHFCTVPTQCMTS